MDKLYVPTKEYNCYTVLDKDTIRAYHTAPYDDTTVNYTDYYVNSHYMERVGSQRFSYTTPVCLNKDLLTTDVYYRNDFDNILTIFFIMFIICIVIPYSIFCKLFRRAKL